MKDRKREPMKRISAKRVEAYAVIFTDGSGRWALAKKRAALRLYETATDCRIVRLVEQDVAQEKAARRMAAIDRAFQAEESRAVSKLLAKRKK